jgi:hypothetical protein
LTVTANPSYAGTVTNFSLLRQFFLIPDRINKLEDLKTHFTILHLVNFSTALTALMELAHVPMVTQRQHV